MWKKYNPNPAGLIVPDCVIRALCKVTGFDWFRVFDELNFLARYMYSVPNADSVWGEYLYEHGFRQILLPHECPRCITIKEFCKIFPVGTYVIGTGGHAVAVENGNYYDSWDSGNEVPTFFWRQMQRGEY